MLVGLYLQGRCKIERGFTVSEFCRCRVRSNSAVRQGIVSAYGSMLLKGRFQPVGQFEAFTTKDAKSHKGNPHKQGFRDISCPLWLVFSSTAQPITYPISG